MPIIVVASLALQLTCGIHAVRNGYTMPWLLIILFFPFVGCAIYFFAVMLPDMQRSHAARQVATDITKLVDPDRDYRRRLEEVELVGSADSKRRLAEDCINRGDPQTAVKLIESAVIGVHADDPALLSSLARARLFAGDAGGAQKALDDLRAANPEWRSGDAHLIYARALEEQEKSDEALREYDALVRYFSGEEAKVRYGLLLQKLGRVGEARLQFEATAKSVERASRHYAKAQREWYNVALRNLGR